MNDAPLHDVRAVTIACNLPGPAAAARLHALGAAVVKVEPPEGDPFEHICAPWYFALCEGQHVERLDLKSAAGRARMDELLADADLLLTSSRPSSLQRLGLAADALHARFPRLCQVAIVGHDAPDEERAGHDLTYVAALGLADPPRLPVTLLADLAGVERTVAACMALLYARERTGRGGAEAVSLAAAAASFAEPLAYGLTAPGARLGGGDPLYTFYRASDGWIALAALEPSLARLVTQHLQLDTLSPASLTAAFLNRTAAEWEHLAHEHGLPIVAVRDCLRQRGFEPAAR